MMSIYTTGMYELNPGGEVKSFWEVHGLQWDEADFIICRNEYKWKNNLKLLIKPEFSRLFKDQSNYGMSTWSETH